METIYLISLIVGGFFVLLSLFGGHDSGHDATPDHDAGLHIDQHGAAATGNVSGAGPGSGFIDLLSIRALFLFAAFFGLTGTLLDLAGEESIFTAIISMLVGLVVGLGGNYLIRRIGNQAVSSDLDNTALNGRTARVIIPFSGQEKGKILLETKGQRVQLVARAFGGEDVRSFEQGEEVVVVRMKGSIAEVLRPD